MLWPRFRNWLSLTPFLLAFALLTETAAASVDVTLQPNQGVVGTKVKASGTGWPAGTQVLIYFGTNNRQPIGTATPDANGALTTAFCVPNDQAGLYPVFFTNGRENFSPSFTITSGAAVNCQSAALCHDTYFIGVHGTLEGPDTQNNNLNVSPVIDETWKDFQNLAEKMGKDVTNYNLDYPGSLQDLFAGAVDPGVQRLNTFIREKVLAVCPTQKIVLVGYSLGAWVVDDWLSRNKDVWPNIAAVELYGDPIWYRRVTTSFGSEVTYHGVARNIGAYPGGTQQLDPYMENSQTSDPQPQGPGVGISDRWQSRCLKGDPVCGEGFNLPGANQLGLVGNCPSNPNCIHRRYTKDGVSPFNNGYNLTERGAQYLAFKAFPPATTHPQVEYPDTSATALKDHETPETYREGVLVFFRLFFTNPINKATGKAEATGFGISWNGLPPSNYTFENPSYGRVHLSQPSFEYPFNHVCGSSNAYESNVEAWINYSTPEGSFESNRAHIHMSCQAPCEVVTPYSTFTWDNTPLSPSSCQ